MLKLELLVGKFRNPYNFDKNLFIVKKLLFVLSLFCLAFFAHGQEIEQLKKELRSNSKNRIQTAVKLKDLYSDFSVDSLFSLGTYLVAEGIAEDNRALMMYGKMTLADYYNSKGKTEFSIRYLAECLDYYTKRGDLEKLAHAQNLMGIAYIYNSQYNKAAHWLIKSIKTSDKLGPDNEAYMGQINLVEVYFREGKLDLAESEILSFIERTRKQNLMNGLKKGYDYLAKIYMHKGDMKLAIAYYKKALTLALRNDSKIGKANAYNNMAIAHFETGDPQLALENFRKALELRIELGQPLGISESYYNLGDWNFYMERLDEAIKYYTISLEVAQKNNLTKEMSDAFLAISETYKEKGNFSKAFENLEKHLEQVTIMREKNQVREIDIQRAAYEMEREEQFLNQKKRERTIQTRVETEQDRGKIIVIGFSLVVGLLIISYFFLLARNRKYGRKQESSVSPIESRDSLYKVQESRWNRIEHFIARNEEAMSTPHALAGFSEHIRFIENFSVLPLDKDHLLFWEAPVSNLENYILKEYLKDQIRRESTPFAAMRALEEQKLVDEKDFTYGIISLHGTDFFIEGKNGLLIQDKDRMSFLTQNKTRLDTFTMLISDQLKNGLVNTSEWERFMDQIAMIRKMSPEMAISTLEECWKEVLKKENAGIMLYFS